MDDHAVGTLCRLIPLDRIDGRLVKARVEVGDTGKSIGTVMRVPGSVELWEGWYIVRDDDGRPASPLVVDAPYASPAAAALRLAIHHFVTVPSGEPFEAVSRDLAVVR